MTSAARIIHKFVDFSCKSNVFCSLLNIIIIYTELVCFIHLFYHLFLTLLAVKLFHHLVVLIFFVCVFSYLSFWYRLSVFLSIFSFPFCYTSFPSLRLLVQNFSFTFLFSFLFSIFFYFPLCYTSFPLPQLLLHTFPLTFLQTFYFTRLFHFHPRRLLSELFHKHPQGLFLPVFSSSYPRVASRVTDL